MKILLPVFTLSLFLFTTSPISTNAQISVVSSDGYTVNIVITPKKIIPSSNSCEYGYNYNVELDYSITYSGPNQPSGLYTLQGTLGCGSSSHFFDLPNENSVGTAISQSNVWNPNPTCNSATVASLSCNTATIEIQGPGINHQFITFSVNTVPLSVSFISFNAIATGNMVKLKWATATETNSAYFAIEKSANGSLWSTIKTIAAAGNSSDIKLYEAFDENPGLGTVQYRLKQVDADGKITYSPVSIVKLTKAGSVITVFPVPNNTSRVSFTGINTADNIVLSIQNINGNTVYSTRLNNSTIQLPAINAGNYFIRLFNNTTGETTNLHYIKL